MRKNTRPLCETHKELCNWWHPKNVLSPQDVHRSSKVKVWWKCPAGNDHEWNSFVFSQVKYPGCPCCSGQLVVKSTCLATRRPDIASQWHCQLNNFFPSDVTVSSAKIAWWQCENDPLHVWQARVFSRTKNKSGCPFCKNKRSDRNNNLLATHPNIAKDWHPTLNNELKPENVVAGSGKSVWWKCAINPCHEWKTMIVHRTQDGTACPYCAGQLADENNCLSTLYPELIKEWHPTKNIITPNEVTPNSHKLAWWKCDKAEDHEFQAHIFHRTKHNSGCPCCCGRKIVKSNCLSTTHPQIAKEWHPHKNRNKTPNDVTYACNTAYWFRCLVDPKHEWLARIDSRTSGKNCLYCNASKGEKLIKEILEEGNIDYKSQYRFPNCKDKRTLPFDFVVFSSGEAIGAIEFQGRQHYKKIDYFGGTCGHESTKNHDKIKKSYCETNGIAFLAVPFWELNVTKKLLENFLQKFSL